MTARILLWLVSAMIGVVGAAGCGSSRVVPLPEENQAVSRVGGTAAKPLPTYTAAAADYNKRVLPLDRLTARATIRLTYTDRDGVEHTEQPDGTLQIIRPRRLALDLGKSGQKLFWFGSDEQRYWWLDLSDREDRFARVGRHALWDISAGGGAAGRRLGVALRPLDLIAAIGVTPIDPALRGATQWSRDGTRLGIVSPPGVDSGFQRVWVDPSNMVPTSIELFDPQRRLVLTSTHEGDERVEITRTGVPGSVGARPRIPARVTCVHHASGTEIRLSLSDAKDGPISDKAFMLEELTRRLGVDRVIDLDAPSTASP